MIFNRITALVRTISTLCMSVVTLGGASANEMSPPITDAAFYAVGHLVMSENEGLCGIFDVENFMINGGRKGSELIRFPEWRLSNLTFNDGALAYWAPWDPQNNGAARMIAAVPYDTPWPGQEIWITSVLPHEADDARFMGMEKIKRYGGINEFFEEEISTGRTSAVSSKNSGWISMKKLPEKYVPNGGPAGYGDGAHNILLEIFSEFSFVSPFSYIGKNYIVARGYAYHKEYKAQIVGIVFEYRPDGTRDDICYYATISKNELDRLAQKVHK